MAYLGRGKPKSELRVNFNRGFEKMFEELSLQISRNLVTSEYAKVNRFEMEMSNLILSKIKYHNCIIFSIEKIKFRNIY